MISTSGCAPFAADLHSLHVPHPSCEQTSACAKAIAADDRPDPGFQFFGKQGTSLEADRLQVRSQR